MKKYYKWDVLIMVAKKNINNKNLEAKKCSMFALIFTLKKSSSRFWGALPKTPKSYNDLIPSELRVKKTHTHTHLVLL
jgi:hypothetical protein